MSDEQAARELAAVRAHFDFLLGRGFQISAQRYDDAAFGNIILDYASPALWIGLVRDRGQFDLAVARTATDERFAWTVLLHVFGAGAEAAALVADTATAAQCAASLARHLAAASAALAPQRYAQTAAEYEQCRAALIKPWWRRW